MADYCLSSILDNIFHNNNVDQKTEINKRLRGWVFKYDCAEKTFNLPPEIPNKRSLNNIHGLLKDLYSQNLFIYNEAFIDNLLRYVEEAYSIHSSSKHLKNCIDKLRKLK